MQDSRQTEDRPKYALISGVGWFREAVWLTSLFGRPKEPTCSVGSGLWHRMGRPNLAAGGLCSWVPGREGSNQYSTVLEKVSPTSQWRWSSVIALTRMARVALSGAAH